MSRSIYTLMTPHKAQKRFGQNFLDDPAAILQIIACIQPQRHECLIEIGPGLGALTRPLLEAVDHLHVIELDRNLIPKLQQLAPPQHLSIHAQDALRVQLDSMPMLGHEALPGQKIRLIGNLPYNIATALVFHFLAEVERIEDMHFMFQKEVADRLVAKAGDPAYGRLSVMTQYYCYNERLFDLSPSSFHPSPKVFSTLVRLRPHATLPAVATHFGTFEQIVRSAFNQRRKTLKNTLSPYLSAEALVACGIDPKQRPEQLTVADFVRLANCVGIV